MSRPDVLVIGAGTVGLCCALSLAERGATVRVVDAAPAGTGASSVNGGWLVGSHLVPLAAPKVIAQGLAWLLDRRSPFYIRPRPSPALICWLWAFRAHCTKEWVAKAAPVFQQLNDLSLCRFHALAQREDMDFGYEERGLLDVHLDPNKMAQAALAAAALEALTGLHTQELDRDALLAQEPNLRQEVVGGFHHQGDKHVAPDRWMAALLGAVRAHGATVDHQTPVVRVEASGRSFKAAHTPQERIQADHVVLAAGTWSRTLGAQLGLRLPIEAGKGYSITIPRDPSHPSTPLRLAEAKVAYTPMGDRARLAGTLELSGIDTSVSALRVEGILQGVRRYLIADGPWESVPPAVGLRPCTPDGLPLIGATPRYDNVVVATGHATVGLTLSPATGELVAQHILGEPLAMDSPLLSVDRFR
jgi:D-amino-acid dehydrogenase